METLSETITLDMDEANELAFKVKIEGATGPAKVRLVCEANEIAYMFDGYKGPGEDVVEFTVPKMKDKIQEGTYDARVEVLIENRYFSPVQFRVNFKKAVQVFAESIRPNKPANVIPEVKVSAISVQRKPQPVAEPAPVIAPRKVVTPQPVQKQAASSNNIQKKLSEAAVLDDAESIKDLIRDVLFSNKKSR